MEERRKNPSCGVDKHAQWAFKYWPIFMALYFFNNGIFVPAVFDDTTLEGYYRWSAVAIGLVSLMAVWYWRYPMLRKAGAAIAFGRFVSAVIPSMFSPPASAYYPVARVLSNGITAMVFLMIAFIETPYIYEMVRSRRRG